MVKTRKCVVRGCNEDVPPCRTFPSRKKALSRFLAWLSATGNARLINPKQKNGIRLIDNAVPDFELPSPLKIEMPARTDLDLPMSSEDNCDYTKIDLTEMAPLQFKSTTGSSKYIDSVVDVPTLTRTDQLPSNDKEAPVPAPSPKDETKSDNETPKSAPLPESESKSMEPAVKDLPLVEVPMTERVKHRNLKRMPRRLRQTESTPELRRQIVRMAERGKSCLEIAREVNLSRWQVARWVGRFKKFGDKLRTVRPGAIRKTTVAKDQAIFEQRMIDPSISAVDIRKKLQLDICAQTIRNRLAKQSDGSQVLGEKSVFPEAQVQWVPYLDCIILESTKEAKKSQDIKNNQFEEQNVAKIATNNLICGAQKEDQRGQYKKNSKLEEENNDSQISANTLIFKEEENQERQYITGSHLAEQSKHSQITNALISPKDDQKVQNIKNSQLETQNYDSQIAANSLVLSKGSPESTSCQDHFSVKSTNIHSCQNKKRKIHHKRTTIDHAIYEHNDLPISVTKSDDKSEHGVEAQKVPNRPPKRNYSSQILAQQSAPKAPCQEHASLKSTSTCTGASQKRQYMRNTSALFQAILEVHAINSSVPAVQEQLKDKVCIQTIRNRLSRLINNSPISATEALAPQRTPDSFGNAEVQLCKAQIKNEIKNEEQSLNTDSGNICKDILFAEVNVKNEYDVDFGNAVSDYDLKVKREDIDLGLATTTMMN